MTPILIGKEDITGEDYYIDNFDEHVAIIGQTGAGKSVLLENIAIQAIQDGLGVTVIDPHSQTAYKIAEHIPDERIDDVIWFDPLADMVIGLNPFDGPGEKAHKAEAAVTMFQNLYGSSFMHASASVLRWNLMALYEQNEPPTMLQAHQMLFNRDYRKKCLKNVKDPLTRVAWNKYENEWTNSQREERFAPSGNKLDQLVNDPLLRTILGQPETGINFDDVLGKNKILLCPLDAGRLGELGAMMLGSIIAYKIYEAALSRQAIKGTWPEHLLMLDEFQIFSLATSIRKLLAQTRKHKVYGVLGTQTLMLIDELERHGLKANTATKICMTVGYDDAEIMSKEFASDKTPPKTLQDCPRGYGYVRTPHYIHGTDIKRPREVRLVKFNKPLAPTGRAKKVIRHSLEHNAKPRQLLAQKVQKFLEKRV